MSSDEAAAQQAKAQADAQAAAQAAAQADAQAAAAAKAQADAQAAAAAKAQADAQAAAKAQHIYQVSTDYSNKDPSPLEVPWACTLGQTDDWCTAPTDSAASLCDTLDLCVGYMVNSKFSNTATLMQHYPDGNHDSALTMYLKPPS